MVTMPPDVVLMRASSTVFVKASSLVNRDLAGILQMWVAATQLEGTEEQLVGGAELDAWSWMRLEIP